MTNTDLFTAFARTAAVAAYVARTSARTALLAAYAAHNA